MTHPLADLIAEKSILLADGATGTSLFAMGLQSGDAPELWNDSEPDNTNDTISASVLSTWGRTGETPMVLRRARQ